MRTDLYFTRLFGLAHERDAKPEVLARAMVNTLLQVSAMNPQGSEALQLVRNTILREAIKTQFGIGRRKRRTKKQMEQAANKQALVVETKKNKGGRPRKNPDVTPLKVA